MKAMKVLIGVSVGVILLAGVLLGGAVYSAYGEGGALNAQAKAPATDGSEKHEPSCDAEVAADKALDSFKSGDLADFASHFEGGLDFGQELTAEAMGRALGTDTASAAKLVKVWYDGAQYRVLVAREYGDKATVVMEVSSVDAIEALRDASIQVSRDAASAGRSMTDAEVTKAAIEKIAGGSADSLRRTETRKITVPMVKTGGEWKINDVNLLPELFPGFLS